MDPLWAKVVWGGEGGAEDGEAGEDFACAEGDPLCEGEEEESSGEMGCFSSTW